MQLNNIFVVKDVIALGVLPVTKAVDIRIELISIQKGINKKGRKFEPHGPLIRLKV